MGEQIRQDLELKLGEWARTNTLVKITYCGMPNDDTFVLTGGNIIAGRKAIVYYPKKTKQLEIEGVTVHVVNVSREKFTAIAEYYMPGIFESLFGRR